MASAEVLEVEEVEAEAEVVVVLLVEGTYVFSIKGDIAISGRAVNSHTRLLEVAVVEAVSGEVEIMQVAKHLEDRGLRHMVDSREQEEDTSSSKEAEVDTANLWAQAEVIPNKEVLPVTVSQLVTEVKAVSQVVTEAKAVSHLVMVARAVSQLVTVVRADSPVVMVVGVVSKMATVVADTLKDRRVATPSLWDVEDILSHRARLLLEDTDSRAVMDNKEAADQVTPHLRVFIVNNLVDIQVAARMRNREEEEVLLVAMEHHLEEEEGQGDIPNIERDSNCLGSCFYQLSSHFLW